MKIYLLPPFPTRPAILFRGILYIPGRPITPAPSFDRHLSARELRLALCGPHHRAIPNPFGKN